MPLPHVNTGSPHVAAHNAERDAINNLETNSATKSDTYTKSQVDAKDSAIYGGTSLGTADLNTITTPGVYLQQTGAESTLGRNYPAAGISGTLEVMRANPSASTIWRIQRFTAFASPAGGRVSWARRSTNATTWEPWRAYASQRVDNTAGRVIYTWDDTANREQLIYGDTGWRDVSDLVTNGWALDTGGNVLLRRIGQRVHIQIRNLVSASATDDAFLVGLPAGFKPRMRNEFMALPVQYGSVVVMGVRTNEADLRIPPAGTARVGNEYHAANAAWMTDNVWPTTLPGSPVGTIPNL